MTVRRGPGCYSRPIAFVLIEADHAATPLDFIRCHFAGSGGGMPEGEGGGRAEITGRSHCGIDDRAESGSGGGIEQCLDACG